MPLEDRCAGEKRCLDQLGALLRRGIEEARDVALRDEKRVAGSDREAVPQAEDELARMEDAAGVGVAERTGGLAHRLSSHADCLRDFEQTRKPEGDTFAATPLAHATAREPGRVTDRAAVLVQNARRPRPCGERSLRRRELDPHARREPDAPHQVLPLGPMRPVAAPVSFEDHEVREPRGR